MFSKGKSPLPDGQMEKKAIRGDKQSQAPAESNELVAAPPCRQACLVCDVPWICRVSSENLGDLCCVLNQMPLEEVFNAHTVSKTGKNFFRRNPGKGKAGRMPTCKQAEL